MIYLEGSIDNKQGICRNTGCGKKYNLDSRKKETEKYLGNNTAYLHCSDRCWIVSTNGREQATKEVLFTR